jgi:hypothetical protein
LDSWQSQWFHYRLLLLVWLSLFPGIQKNAMLYAVTLRHNIIEYDIFYGEHD